MDSTKVPNYLDLFVVEDHDEVLVPLYRKIGSKKLPFEGMCMIHFDSHSDMSVPKELIAYSDGTLPKHEVYSQVSIENWIIPALYSGHIDSVVWFHPYWTSHSFQLENSFKVGRCMESNFLKVTSASNHFLSEDSFEHEELLADCREVRFAVREFDPAHPQTTSKQLETVKMLRDLIQCRGNAFILDIDLDFFSTKDPFLDMMGIECYDFLRHSYEFTPPMSHDDEDIRKCVVARRQQLKKMRNYFESLSNGEQNFERKSEFWNILKNAFPEGQDHDWMWLHEIGTGMDDCPLPHHVSTEEEIRQLICYMEDMLSKLPNPSVIFIARSSQDDYCPIEQVDAIQAKVLDMLDRLYGNIRTNFLYKK